MKNEKIKKNKIKLIIKILIGLILTLMMLFFGFIYIRELGVINYNKFKYNYKEYDNFINEEERINIINNIAQNENIIDNPLSEEFENSRGLLIEFNKSNAYSKFKEKNIEFLYDYYKKVRKPYATDFIFNILIINSVNANDLTLDLKKESVDYHYDTTLDVVIKSKFFERDLVPECVSVLYVDTPENFIAGRLKLFRYSSFYHVGDVTPAKGKLVEFNGKIYHGVENIIDIDNNNGTRMSLVLEQYIRK